MSIQVYRFVGLILIWGSVFANPQLESQIEDLSKQIEQDPVSGQLLLQRSDLYRQNHDLDNAAADVAKARMLAPGLRLLDWYEGRIALDSGDFAAANKFFSIYIEAHAEHKAVFYLRGQARDGLHEYLFAADDYARAIALSQNPASSFFQAQALSLFAANELDAAFVVATQGLSRFPHNDRLLGLAVEFSLLQGDIRQALALFMRLPPGMQDMPRWQFRQAIWHCVEGHNDKAATVLSRLLNEEELEAQSSEHWSVPVAGISNLLDKPSPEACLDLVRELLLNQFP